MATTSHSSSLVPVQPVFTDAERLALAGFLAGYRGLTREAYTLDLRQFTGWCRTRSLPLFSVRRADIETFARELEARGRARATVTRRLCTIAGFYKYAVEEELLEHSRMPVNPVIRPADIWREAGDPLVRQIQSGPLVAVLVPDDSDENSAAARSDDARWQRGEADVEQLVRRRELEHVTGAAADGAALLVHARRTVATAAGLVHADAYSAYVLAYDAARFACNALLTQQGMRATTDGGAIMPWNKRSGLSSARDSGHSQTCGAGEMNSNTRACQLTRQRQTKLSRPSRSRSALSRAPTAC
jgi:hypothetical protein